MTRLQIQLGSTVVPLLAHVRGQQYRRYLAGQLLDVLKDADAILSPTAPWVAPHEDPAIAGEAGAAEGRRTGLYNLSGLPALTVTAALAPVTCPSACRLPDAQGRDGQMLAIGAAFEALRPDVNRQPPLQVLVSGLTRWIRAPFCEIMK